MTGINPDDVRKEPESLQRSHDTLLNGLLASNTTSDSSGASRQQTNNPELDAAYAQLASLQRSHDTLLHHLSATNDILNPLHPAPSRRTSTRHDGDAIFVDTATTSDDSTEDEDGSFVQDELPFHSFDHEHLREHLKTHDWTQHGWEILAPILSDPAKLFKQPHLFHTGPGPADDRSHYSHFQVYNVGPDGLPEPVEVTGSENMSKAVEIWHTLRNIGKQQDEKVVGRITIAREPSPILFGALHLTQNGAFDMDELFQHLVGTEASSAHMFRAFDESPRRHKTFVFRFSYYTLIGEECVPMRWQDRHDPPNHHVPLSRCSAVVALALHDDNPRRIRNRAKRAKTQFGWVTDVWSPWQVLQLESFPDWKSTPLNGTPYTFETGHKYLNGAEAFLLALLTEFRDARKRYHAIYQSITELVSPPARFLFSEELRRSRLFEDKDFTWISRYFFAQQTLIMVNDSMKSMIDAFEDTFTDDVWEGQNKMLWPLYEDSPRNDRWKRRLRLSRLMFERELKELRILMRENNEKGHEIEALREQLYSVTSIKESRKSVEQGNNIKVLTLVNLFFMPLTFVTSIFGMTNMPNPAPFWPFAIVLVAVSIPLFSAIGFLSTKYGYGLWTKTTKTFWRWLRSESNSTVPREVELEPSMSTSRVVPLKGSILLWLQSRGKSEKRRITPMEVPKPSYPHIQRIVEQIGEGRNSGQHRIGRLVANAEWSIEEIERNGRVGRDAVIDIREL